MKQIYALLLLGRLVFSSKAQYANFTGALTFSETTSNSRNGFLGRTHGIRPRVFPAGRVGFVRTVVECKESRIGKQPIEVPSNVTLTLEEQFVKAKGPLGELSLSFPGDVKIVKEESGKLRVYKTAETQRANQMHGLFR